MGDLNALAYFGVMRVDPRIVGDKFVTARCGLAFRSGRLCAMPKVNPWFDPGINPDSHPGVDALARARAAR